MILVRLEQTSCRNSIPYFRGSTKFGPFGVEFHSVIQSVRKLFYVYIDYDPDLMRSCYFICCDSKPTTWYITYIKYIQSYKNTKSRNAKENLVY